MFGTVSSSEVRKAARPAAALRPQRVSVQHYVVARSAPEPPPPLLEGPNAAEPAPLGQLTPEFLTLMGALSKFLESSTYEEAAERLEAVTSGVASNPGLFDESAESEMGPRAALQRLRDAAYSGGGEAFESAVSEALADWIVTIKSGGRIEGTAWHEFLALVLSLGMGGSGRRLSAGLRCFIAAQMQKLALEAALPGPRKPPEVSWFQYLWARPCQDQFEYFAKREPRALATWLNDETLSAGLRARAAEAAGLIDDAETARELLLPLVETGPLLVQEAAVYALGQHLSADLHRRLKKLASESGTHPIVVNAVESLLDVA